MALADDVRRLGKVIGIDPDLVVPDKSRSVYDGAIAPWRGEKMGVWLEKLVRRLRGQV